ncbi:MAG: bi-domain-containing oxidoreductase [Deltaproteobacteria bacterium]|nr:bi-domain-containing oxidoreductase [Deltaproteobacteria bacterium]
MKQVLVKQGQVVVEEVPAPLVEPGTLLVRVDHSCISIGTEMSGLKGSGIPLWKRALTEPDKVRKALAMVATQGLSHTRGVVEGKLHSGNPTGYSAAGRVLEAGEGIEDIGPGDPVACAGSQYAHHAEIIRVPRNLAVRIPAQLGFPAASTVTLGAIALQGVRRARPTLGETFVVIGLGILGQLTVQLLRVNGCRTIGTDLDGARIALARGLGMGYGVHPDDGVDVEQVARLTEGLGADGVIITAATPSDAVVSTAFRMCRKKGRVVLVGDVGLNLNRADFYQKELDFLVSTSYGPGRYDNAYEEKGVDYPVPYVRWTENRNMAEYVRLLAEGKITVSPLVSAVYPVDQASAAYESLKKEGPERPLMVLLSYPDASGGASPSRTIPNPFAVPTAPGRIRLALVGAGGFARGTHLPNVQALSDRFQLQAVASRTGTNAAAVARQFGAAYSSTDYRELLADPAVEAVLIATRHRLHAPLALEAMRAGKHVLVEKPLALTREELDPIVAFYGSGEPREGRPVLLTGFNRRFSPYARAIHEAVKDRTSPMVLNYRMNAGYIPLTHWVHTEEGGGRNLGEACHIYDLFTFFTGSRHTSVTARSIVPATGQYGRRDNFVATVSFADGSVATLTYTALGSNDYPKEHLEVFVDGKVIVLENYKRLSLFGSRAKGMESALPEKGHREELAAFARAIWEGGEWPIPLWQQVQATEIAFSVEDSLFPGCPPG